MLAHGTNAAQRQSMPWKLKKVALERKQQK